MTTIAPSIVPTGEASEAFTCFSNGNPDSTEQIRIGDTFSVTFGGERGKVTLVDAQAVVTSSILSPSDFDVSLDMASNQITVTYKGAPAAFPPGDSFCFKISIFEMNPGADKAEIQVPVDRRRYRDPIPPLVTVTSVDFPLGIVLPSPYTPQVTFTNPGNQYIGSSATLANATISAGSFSGTHFGDGSGLTNLRAGEIGKFFEGAALEGCVLDTQNSADYVVTCGGRVCVANGSTGVSQCASLPTECRQFCLDASGDSSNSIVLARPILGDVGALSVQLSPLLACRVDTASSVRLTLELCGETSCYTPSAILDSVDAGLRSPTGGPLWQFVPQPQLRGLATVSPSRLGNDRLVATGNLTGSPGIVCFLIGETSSNPPTQPSVRMLVTRADALPTW